MNIIKRTIKKILPSFVMNIIKRFKYKKLLHFPIVIPIINRYLYPDFLAISLTTKCNLRCFFCRTENTKTDTVDFNNIIKLEKAIKYSKIISLSGWGEPLVYPKFKDVLAFIYKVKKNAKLQLTTNGTLLSKEYAYLLAGHISSLLISINAAKEETYNRDMKGGYFKKTISRIREFMSVLDEKDKLNVKFHFVAHTKNFREIPDFIILVKKIGGSNVSIGHYVISNKDHLNYMLLNVKKEYNDVISKSKLIAKKEGIKLSAKEFYSEKPRDVCLCDSPYRECYILTSGDGAPCCYSGNHFMGNVYKDSFESVWFGEEFIKLRKERYLPACKICTPFLSFDSKEAHLSVFFDKNKK